MGGERSSTTRQREEGKICAECRISLAYDPDHVRGERLCPRCNEARKPKRKIYMYFMNVNSGWYGQFLEADLKTSLRRKLTFASSDKVIELIRRSGGIKDLADKQAIEHAISMGRGGAHLYLTAEQYAALNGSEKASDEPH